MSYSLPYLAKHFGFHHDAFQLPPSAYPDSDEHVRAWKKWIADMEDAFGREHKAKPVYPDFTKFPHKGILMNGRKEMEDYLLVHKHRFRSTFHAVPLSQRNAKEVASHYPLTKRVLAYSYGYPDSPETQRIIGEALQESLQASQSDAWGSHEVWHLRVRMLMHASRLALRRLPLMIASMVSEVGMSPREAFGEYDEVIDFIRGYAVEAAKTYLDEWHCPPKWKGDVHGHRASSHGVAMVVAPFNFPLAIGAGSMGATALVMGNTVVYCPSEKTLLCGYLGYALLRDAIAETSPAFRPQEIIHFAVSNRGDMIRELLKYPEVSVLSFTGSSRVFALLEKEASGVRRWNGGDRLVIGAAETSGVNPVYVDKHADVLKAARELPGSFLGRTGHKCSSTRNILVHENVYASFKQGLFDALNATTYGDPFEGAYFGPVVSEDAQRDLWTDTQKLVSEGIVTIAYTKEIVTTGGYDFPAIVLEATPAALENKAMMTRLRNTEFFGPVTCLVKVSSVAVAVEIAALSDFALTTSVYSEDVDVQLYWLKHVRAGNSNVNMPPTGALAVSQWFGAPPSLSGCNSGAKGPDLLRRLRSEKAISGPRIPDGISQKDKESLLARYRRIMTFSRGVSSQ